MTILWSKIDKSVNREGTTITYRGTGTTMLIQSRKRHIPHANGIGTWDHTTYWVMDNGQEIKERYSLKDAKDYAAEYWEGKHETH